MGGYLPDSTLSLELSENKANHLGSWLGFEGGWNKLLPEFSSWG